jgi:hypothetical protein
MHAIRMSFSNVSMILYTHNRKNSILDEEIV